MLSVVLLTWLRFLRDPADFDLLTFSPLLSLKGALRSLLGVPALMNIWGSREGNMLGEIGLIP